MVNPQTEYDPSRAILWLDLEFTGLDDKRDVVIEVGAISTRGLFEVQGVFRAFIRHPEGLVASLIDANPWWANRPEHREVMLQSSDSAPSQLKEVAAELSEFALDSAGEHPLSLAGNSVHFDRRWVMRDFPELEDRLDHRMLDVSSLKLAAAELGIPEYKKKEEHRSISDIHESMAELKYLLDALKKA